MADLAVELANLNSNARELIAKYNESFERLDEKSKKLAQKLVNDINGYLEELQKAKDNSLNEIVEKLNNGINELNAIIESGEFTRVITQPVIDIAGLVSAGYEKTFSVSAKSLLTDGEIEKFEVTIGDKSIETDAVDGKADITYKFDGNVGDTVSISVIAVDNLGNKSAKTTKEVKLVENTPPTKPAVEAPDEVTKGTDFTIKIHGSTDSEGDSVIYKIKDGGSFTFSKTEAIAENEEITVTAPSVDEDTQMSFSVVAVDSNGLESEGVSVIVLVKNIVPFEGVLYQTFDTAGTYTFTVPETKDTIEVEVWGAGGGGGSSGAGSGGAGGDGGYAKSRLNVTPGETITVIVGKGGAGGHYGDVGVYGGSGDGWHGKTTSFGNYLYATGGQAGHGGNSSPGNGGGTGGQGYNGNIINSKGANGCDGCGRGSNGDLGKAANVKGGLACYTNCYAQDGGDGLVKIYI